MDFLKANYLDTTTQLTINTGTDTASYLMDRDPRFQFISSGYTGVTVATIKISFSETLTVSRIAIVGHNLKSFTVFYNGATANTFALLSGATTVSDFSTNSESSTYLQATPVACTSVSIDLKLGFTTGVEKAIGYLVVCDTHVTLDRPPPSKGYKIKIDSQDITHKLSDGGTRIQGVADKYNLSLSYNHLSTAQRNSLFDLWERHEEFVICPFGTTTAWDEVIFPCVWAGDFDFFEFSDNASSSGFTGKINLMETPR